MTENRFDSEVTHHYLTGQTEGVEVACRYLREQAGKAFSVGDDKRAWALRDLADELVREVLPELQATAEKYRVDYLQDETEPVR